MEKFWIELVYNDGSETSFYVDVDGEPYEYRALLNMITRGTLMASGARHATCYNDEGFDVVSYTK